MPCYHPLNGFKATTTTKNGKRKIAFGSGGFRDLPVTVPCGQCIGCRLERSRQWAVRLMHERQSHDLAVFITLTYDDEHLPPDMSLNYEHWRLFMMRLRKLHYPAKIRFYHCGEYGEHTQRPHYHAILFGIDFADKKALKNSASQNMLYMSDTLTKTWGMGHAWIGSVSFESCAYVARYVTKKVTGDEAAAHYTRLNTDTGEIFQVKPEYSTMSRNPGIGAKWYEKYSTDVFPSDSVITRGKETKPPRFYLERLARESEKAATNIKRKRIKKAALRKHDSTPERLAVRKTVLLSRISTLKRNLE